MSKKADNESFNNRLLDSLPQGEKHRFDAELQVVTHKVHDVLYETHGPIEHVYFPSSCVASALTVMTDGCATGVAMIGNEGVVGHTAANPSRTSANRLTIQIAGDSLIASSIRRRL